MDARLVRVCTLCALLLVSSAVSGATYATKNFVVHAPDEETARKVAECAEFWRKDLAVQWLGETLPNWSRPCPIRVKVGRIGAGGATTFTFDHGEVFGWNMEVQGSLERILDSVIPHEVNHTIFATYFRRPVPRWADEGAATLFEHESERKRQVMLLDEVLHTSRRIPLNQLLQIKEYPADMRDVLTLYAEGYALAEFLVGIKGDQGRQVFLKFLKDAPQLGWDQAIKKHYGFSGVDTLERDWKGWVVAGWPALNAPGESLALADTQAREQRTSDLDAVPELVVRSQSPQPQVFDALPMFDRTLRIADPRRPDNRVSSAAPLREPAMEAPAPHSARGDAEGVRPRMESRLEARSSLLPHSLAPTADGVFTDPDSAAFQFPSRR